MGVINSNHAGTVAAILLPPQCPLPKTALGDCDAGVQEVDQHFQLYFGANCTLQVLYLIFLPSFSFSICCFLICRSDAEGFVGGVVLLAEFGLRKN